MDVQYAASQRQCLMEFQAALRGRGILTTIRQEMGGDVDGACGQLALKGARAGACEDPAELF